MAAAAISVEYTITASPVRLTTALGLSTPLFFSDGTIRAGKTNVGDVYLGTSNLTTAANRGIYLDAEESYSLSFNGRSISSNAIWVAGTADDVIHIFLMS